MKINVFGRDKREVEKLKKELGKDFIISNKPEIIISYGGDGTLLLAERRYPGIPKLMVRYKSRCYKCTLYGLHSKKHIKEVLMKKKYKIMNAIKLEARVGRNKLIGMNDIIVRNKNLTTALRFSLKVGKRNYKEIIGDGIVVATPFGSNGYFNSITRTHIYKGMGVAFNNPIYDLKPLILKNDAKIELKVMREDAEVGADNLKEVFTLKKGDALTIKKSKQKVKMVKVRE